MKIHHCSHKMALPRAVPMLGNFMVPLVGKAGAGASKVTLYSVILTSVLDMIVNIL